LIVRTAIALGGIVFMMAGYTVLSLVIEPSEARELRTAWDDAIPFVPWTVFLYSWVYTSMTYPAFVIRSPGLFARVVLAVFSVIAISLLAFGVMPVSAVQLRPDVSTLDLGTFAGWGVRLTYFIDPPYNLFPSLHLSIATLSVLSVWTARRLWGVLASPVVVAIAVSILTMKQHFIADGLAALVLATTAWALVVRTYRPTAQDAPGLAWGWRASVAYLVFHSFFYGAFWVAYRLGCAPWPN